MQAGKLSLSFVAVGSFSCATILSVHASKNFRCAAGLVEKISIDDDAKKQSTKQKIASQLQLGTMLQRSDHLKPVRDASMQDQLGLA